MAINDPVGSPVWELRTLALGTEAGLAAAVEGVAADARRIYLTHYLFQPQNPSTSPVDGKLVVLDADTLTMRGQQPVGGQPRGVAINPATSRGYVLNTFPVGSLMVFDTFSLENLVTIALADTPRRVAISPRHNRIYIVVSNPARGFVQVIDGSTNATLPQSIPADGATGIAVDDAANRVYVTLAPVGAASNGALVVIDSTTNQIVRSVPLPPGQSQPGDIAVLPGSNRIYLAHLIPGAVPSPRLTVLDRNGFTTIGQVSLPAPATHLAADSQANKVYAATAVGVVVIDAANRIETVIPVEQEPLGVAVSPHTRQVVIGDASGGRASVATQPSQGSSDLTLLRADDLLHLEFDFVNLRLVTSGGPRLVREVAGQPAFVVVHLTPQSLAERTRPAGEAVVPPLRARLAGRSRLAFRVPNTLAEIPYTVQGLLDWSQLEPSLVPVALPRGPASAVPNPPPLIVQPSSTQTAIELPYRLTLSPDATATWVHADGPVTGGGQTELWHTGLISRQDDGRDPAVRAVWSPDFETPDDPRPLSSVPLQPSDRSQIVSLTSDFTLVHEQFPYLPEPVEIDELMLSALGGWLKVRGAWNAPPELNFDLASWHQITTLGRDHYVRVVKRGALFPFGHRAVQITVTEREITAGAGVNGDQEPVAALRTRQYLVVLEPEKRYTGQPYANAGREMPFARGVRLLTTVTPDIDPTELVVADAFWVRTTDGAFSFDVAAEDPEGRPVTFATQMIFIPEGLLSGSAGSVLVRIREEYVRVGERRAGVVPGQPVAFVEPRVTGGASADISLTTERLYFDAQSPASGPDFLPMLQRAKVRIPAVEQLLGVSQPVDIHFYSRYLTGGLDSSAKPCGGLRRPWRRTGYSPAAPGRLAG